MSRPTPLCCRSPRARRAPSRHPAPARTSVLVADPNPLFLAGLTALVHAAPGLVVTGQASGGDEAVREALRIRPDVALLARACGAVAARVLDRADPPKVVVLAESDREPDARAALRAGASGFLLTSVPPPRLIAAIRSVAAGDLIVLPGTARVLAGSCGGGVDPAGPDLDALTPREAEVVGLVGRALGNAEIAHILGLGESTVKTHLNRAMTKLGLSRRSQVVALAYEKGLITPERST